MSFGTNQSIPTGANSVTLPWMENFSTVFTASPTDYGFTAVEAADVATVVAAYRAAYDAAGVAGRMPVAPGNYTQPLRAALAAAAASCLSVVRPLAAQMQQNPGISDEDLLLIGVQPKNYSRTPIFVPGTTPILGIQFASMGSHVLSYADSSTPASKRKPFGAAGLQLFVGIGYSVTALQSLRYYSTFTRNPAVVAFQPADSGKIATYAARWIGRRGDEGPWSATLDAVIMFSQAEALVPVS